MEHASHHDSPEALHYHESTEPARRRAGSAGFIIVSLLLLAAVGFLAYQLNQRNHLITDLRAELSQASSATTGVKADLKQANAKSVDLQSQLDAANLQITATQAQLQKNQESGAGLQSQLEQARAEAQAQQEKDKSQLADLQAQVTQANSMVAGLRNDVAAARKEAADAKGQLAKAMEDMAKLQPAATVATAAPVRPLPMSTEFKKGFFSSTLTLQIRNTGSNPLKLNLGITGSDKTPSTYATVEAGDSYKLEGLAPGAQIVVSSEGYEPVTLTAR